MSYTISQYKFMSSCSRPFPKQASNKRREKKTLIIKQIMQFPRFGNDVTQSKQAKLLCDLERKYMSLFIPNRWIKTELYIFFGIKTTALYKYFFFCKLMSATDSPTIVRFKEKKKQILLIWSSWMWLFFCCCLWTTICSSVTIDLLLCLTFCTQ